MNSQKAIEILNAVTMNIPLTREQHQTVVLALETLKLATQPKVEQDAKSGK